jgi:hypothetical protein
MQLFPDSRLSLEPIEKDRVSFHIGVRNLQSNRAIVVQIEGTKDRRHPAARDRLFDSVVIDLQSWFYAFKEPHRGRTLHAGCSLYSIGSES